MPTDCRTALLALVVPSVWVGVPISASASWLISDSFLVVAAAAVVVLTTVVALVAVLVDAGLPSLSSPCGYVPLPTSRFVPEQSLSVRGSLPHLVLQRCAFHGQPPVAAQARLRPVQQLHSGWVRQTEVLQYKATTNLGPFQETVWEEEPSSRLATPLPSVHTQSLDDPSRADCYHLNHAVEHYRHLVLPFGA